MDHLHHDSSSAGEHTVEEVEYGDAGGGVAESDITAAGSGEDAADGGGAGTRRLCGAGDAADGLCGGADTGDAADGLCGGAAYAGAADAGALRRGGACLSASASRHTPSSGLGVVAENGPRRAKRGRPGPPQAGDSGPVVHAKSIIPGHHAEVPAYGTPSVVGATLPLSVAAAMDHLHHHGARQDQRHRIHLPAKFKY
jgi:hypothetical protein